MRVSRPAFFSRTHLLRALTTLLTAVAASVQAFELPQAKTQRPKVDARLLAPLSPATRASTVRNAASLMFLVKLYLAAEPDSLIEARLRQAGLTITAQAGRQVEGWVDAGRLANLEALPEVHFIQRPEAARTQASAPVNTGLTILHAGNLQALGATGAGVRVGVISDGVTGLTAARSQGAVPLVTVVNDDCKAAKAGDCAEGTAMLELVHGMAPDASLAFCGAASALSVGDCLSRLADDFHADIVVDDLYSFDEPMFEDGPIAVNVNNRAAKGVTYLSSAGNHYGCNYEADFSAHVMPGGLVYDAVHDFGRASGGASNTGDSLVVPAGGQLEVALQWNDPFETSSNNYDLHLFDAAGDIVASSTNIQDGSHAPALELLDYTNSTGLDQTLTLVIARAKGAATRHFKLYFNDGGSGCDGVQQITYVTPGIGGIFGHSVATGALAVAALDSTAPATRESFSATGPVRMDFPSRVMRAKPDLSALDNLGVTGSAGFGGPGNCGASSCFLGTSAAAPEAAGIIAQLRSRFSGNITQAVLDSAIPLGAHNLFGAGRIDAMAAARKLNKAPTASITSPATDTTTLVSMPVNFEGACSDPEALPGVTAQWNFGTGSGLSATTDLKPGARSFNLPGTYTVTLRCTDALGVNSQTVNRVITVQNPSSGGGGGGGAMEPLALLGLLGAIWRRRSSR